MKISEIEYKKEVKLIAQEATRIENEKKQNGADYIDINTYVFQILEKHKYTTSSINCLAVLFYSYNDDAYFASFEELTSTNLFDTYNKLATAAMFEDVIKVLDDMAEETDDI